MIQIPAGLVREAEERMGEIQVSPPFIACVNGVMGHTDEGFPPWSALLVLRNDDCLVWQRGGYRGIPRAGEIITLCIHKMHGVVAPRRNGLHTLVVLGADSGTEETARKMLDLELRRQRRKAKGKTP